MYVNRWTETDINEDMLCKEEYLIIPNSTATSGTYWSPILPAMLGFSSVGINRRSVDWNSSSKYSVVFPVPTSMNKGANVVTGLPITGAILIPNTSPGMTVTESFGVYLYNDPEIGSGSSDTPTVLCKSSWLVTTVLALQIWSSGFNLSVVGGTGCVLISAANIQLEMFISHVKLME